MSVNPSCAVTKLIDAIGRRPSISYRSQEPVKRDANSPRLRRLAAPEVADRVAVLAVPLRPQRREAADLVAAVADVPRLGDQLDLATTGSWLTRSKNAASRLTSWNSRASAAARSKRNPSTCISVTQYRSESMISRSDSWWRTLRLFPVPVVS